MKSFRQFVEQKDEGNSNKEWRKEYINLPKGFEPPDNMVPIVQAFLDSGSIELTNDTSSSVTMPKKSLFLVGEPVRDFLLNPSKRPKNYDLATNATPEQIALILHSAGFKAERVSDADEMNLSFKPEPKGPEDKKTWFLKDKDTSKEGKPLAIGAVVNGEVFEIATFRKNKKTVNGKSEVNFVDNPHEDSQRRDLTINSMYIELTKPDGENKKLYDPTRKGYGDVFSGTVKTVGKAEEKFEEDKIGVMSAIRLHCKFGKSKPMDKEMESVIPKFASLEGVASERIREEFLKGLEDPDVDPLRYVNFYKKFNLLNRVFPGIAVRTDMPKQLRNKKDKFVALAWMLQDNPVEKVQEVLGSNGWSNGEKATISYLISLREFSTDEIESFLKQKKKLGVTKDQIQKWTDMFDVVDGGSVKSVRPAWSKNMRRFASFEPDHRKLVHWYSDPESKEIHPEISARNIPHDIPAHFRGSILQDINREKLKGMFEEIP